MVTRIRILVSFAFISFFLAGCGSSSSDYIGYTNTNQISSYGDLTFRFAQSTVSQAVNEAQSFSVTVPAGTTSLKFEFRRSAGESESYSPLYAFTAAYASKITVADIPVEAKFVVITAYAKGGVPLAKLGAEIKVVADQASEANLKNASFTPIEVISLSAPDVSLQVGATSAAVVSATFSNGEQAILPWAAYSLSLEIEDETIASFSNGLFSGLADGSTTYSLSFSGKDATGSIKVTDSSLVPHLEVTPSFLQIPQNDYVERKNITVIYYSGKPGDSGTDVSLLVNYGPSLGGANPNSFSIATGNIWANRTANDGDTALIPITYHSPYGVVSASLPITVGEWVYASLEFEQNPITINNDLRAGSFVPTYYRVLSNGWTFPDAPFYDLYDDIYLDFSLESADGDIVDIQGPNIYAMKDGTVSVVLKDENGKIYDTLQVTVINTP